MTITQLQYFLCASGEGNFSEAAAKLFVSQPAVSKQISLLEKELGFRLFERTGRNLRLTEDGERFRACVQRCQDDLTQTLQDIRRRDRTERFSLHIGCSEYWNAAYFYKTLYNHLTIRHDDAQISLEACLYHEMLSGMDSGDFDLCLSYENTFKGRRGLVTETFGILDCGVLYSRDDFPELDLSQDMSKLADIPIFYIDDESDPFLPMLQEIISKYKLGCPMVACKRYSSMVSGLLCGSGLIMASRWHYLLSNRSIGFLSIGRELPVSAAFPKRLISLPKYDMIQEALEILKECVS